MEKLKELNALTLRQRSLISFGNFENYKAKINGIRICNEEIKACENEEINFKIVLEENDISVDTFLLIQEKMRKLDYRMFYRSSPNSLWISGGAFGDINGYLLAGTDKIPDTFRLNDKYYIYVGKMVTDNVYHFSGH